MSKVITISREFGSGGHDIGVKVANALGVPFYDHDIVDKAVEESGFSQDFVEEHGEHTSFFSALFGSPTAFSNYYYGEDPQDKVFRIQRDIITQYAKEGPCVIVGRCSNYILQAAKVDSFDIFIRADIETRMKNVADRVDLKGDDLVQFLQKKDNRRGAYYRFYTRKRWGDYKDYNMMLDSGMLGKEKCVQLILDAIKE